MAYATNVSRAEATYDQIVHHDLTMDITGEDFFLDTQHAILNVGVGTVHFVQGIIPSIAGAFSDQKWTVAPRQGTFHETANTVSKVVNTKGIIPKVVAVGAEAFDGVTNDVIHAFTGAPDTVIVPSSSPAVTTSTLEGVQAESADGYRTVLANEIPDSQRRETTLTKTTMTP